MYQATLNETHQPIFILLFRNGSLYDRVSKSNTFVLDSGRIVERGRIVEGIKINHIAL